MAKPVAVFDALLAGYFGFGNLGDELLLDAAVRNLEKCGISRGRIAALSNSPARTSAVLGIEAFNRWNARQALSALGMTRALLLPGGGLFQDSTSSRSCVYYWGLVRAALAKRARVLALGQSVGPLSGRLARLLTRNALGRCSFLAVRDTASEALLSLMGIKCGMMPDPVLSLETGQRPLGEGVLINVRPVAGNKHILPVLRAAQVLSGSGVKLTGVAMSGDDAAMISGLRKSGELPVCDIVRPESLGEFAEIAGGARAAVGMRLHFGVLSALCGLNVALSSYDPKVSSFAEMWNIKKLKNGGVDENFAIMRLLTKSRFGDKKIFEEISSRVTEQFRAALEYI